VPGDGEARGIEGEEVVVHIVDEDFPGFVHGGDEVLGGCGGV